MSDIQTVLEDFRASKERLERELIALRVECDRLRKHSVTLNSIGWRMAVALGDAKPGATEVECDPEEQLTRLLSKLELQDDSGQQGGDS